jgi:hypothetical protein
MRINHRQAEEKYSNRFLTEPAIAGKPPDWNFDLTGTGFLHTIGNMDRSYKQINCADFFRTDHDPPLK